MVKRCVRFRLREGLIRFAAHLGIAPSTVGQVLTSCRLDRLSVCGRDTGEPIRCYEHDHLGLLVHVEVKNFGSIPDGGGWCFVG